MEPAAQIGGKTRVKKYKPKDSQEKEKNSTADILPAKSMSAYPRNLLQVVPVKITPIAGCMHLQLCQALQSFQHVAEHLGATLKK